MFIKGAMFIKKGSLYAKKVTASQLAVTTLIIQFTMYLLSGSEVFLQRFHIVSESLCPRRGYLASGTRHFPFEAFLDGDVARFGQFVNLHAQVARGGTRMLLEVVEVSLLYSGKERHDGQSQFRVQ